MTQLQIKEGTLRLEITKDNVLALVQNSTNLQLATRQINDADLDIINRFEGHPNFINFLLGVLFSAG